MHRNIGLCLKKTLLKPRRVRSGAELIDAISSPGSQVLTTLIHKFGMGIRDAEGDRITVSGKKATRSTEEVMEMIAAHLPAGFKPSGRFFVFVDECHRTQGGLLHEAMTRIMGDNYTMIGFTGTPLLKKRKRTSLEQFGPFIHTYKFDEAVRDGVILDLRYEARSVPQTLSDQNKEMIDRMFESRTMGLNPQAKEALKTRWATLQKLYSSEDRMKRIVGNICEDMELLAPLVSGFGNAMLVAGDVYQAYKYYDLFQQTDELRGHCCVVTSYDPAVGVSIREGHSDDSRLDEETFKHDKASEMMGEMDANTFEQWAKQKFIDEPNDMKLIIVVDKLLTGFDAPKATFLYIDKHMEDHNLFQAICRVNRVSDEWKEFGYIIDYKDLFNEIRDAVDDYTNGHNAGALFGFDEGDVENLLTSRLKEGKKALDDAIEELQNYVLPVREPKKADQYFNYFVYDQATTPADEQMATAISNGNKREGFYNLVGKLVNRYLAIATQMVEAGYTTVEAKDIHTMVSDFVELRDAIMLRSGDNTDLKQYNAMMRKLLDRYVQAPASEVLAKLDDFTFLDVVGTEQSPEEAADELIHDVPDSEPSVAETITANVRRYVVRKRDQNPDFYDKLSEKLNRLLEEYRQKTLEYKEMLTQILALVQELRNSTGYPQAIDTPLKKALFDNLGRDEELALRIYDTVRTRHQPNWRELLPRRKALRIAIRNASGIDGDQLDAIITIIASNHEF